MIPTVELLARLAESGRPKTEAVAHAWGRKHPRLAKRFGQRAYAWDLAAVEMLTQGLAPAEVAARLAAMDRAEGN